MRVSGIRCCPASRRAVVGLTVGLVAVAVPATAVAGTATASTQHRAGASHAGASAAEPLKGKIVGIDPGHNGRNWTDPAYLNRQVWNGREWEDCDTTGTETAKGYTEARFNWNVARYLRQDLEKYGAKVVMTRKSNDGIGPCVTTRARILNKAHADVSVDIHADGGPPSGRGFTVLEPVADGPNDKVINASLRFAKDVHAEMLRYTPMMVSDYYGHDGYIRRDDLAGLNLTTEPKVLIECGNMQNSQDAALLVQASVQRHIARALAQAIVEFLTGK